jgi:NADH-quinone oxidoreductase subunit M
MILSAVYMLWMYQRVIMGDLTNPANQKLIDLNMREKVALIPICLLILWMGVYPSVFLSRSEHAVREIKTQVTAPPSSLHAGAADAR